jgi:tetrahydromethanopterin S-methyltransferase subunit A
MKESLESLQTSLSSLQVEISSDLLANTKHWLKQMEPIEYACLGCEYCFPAVAMSVFHKALPEIGKTQPLSCAFEVSEQNWPPVAGEYYAFCDGAGCPVGVSTLASVELAERLAHVRPIGLCIVGKTETENIGIDKIVKNTVTNPTIRFLLLAGKDSKGHQSGRTLLALEENGVDENMKVIGSPGRRPLLRNVTREEVEAFRKQVEVVDMIGCENEERIVERIEELSQRFGSSCSSKETGQITRPVRPLEVPIIHAEEPIKVKMDKAGYFVILPQPEKQTIVVEHYSYDNTLQRVIEGKDARSIYWTIIRNGWVTQLSHAAYLGKELAKAELSIKLGVKYIQDGA